MLTSNDGYCLTYYKTKNQIIICLPQTCETATNTYEKVIDRRTDVEEKDLNVLLNIVELIFFKEKFDSNQQWREEVHTNENNN